MNQQKHGLRILLYLGHNQDPTEYIRFGLSLVEYLCASPHVICALLLPPKDPLIGLFHAQGINVIELLPELCQTKSRIRRCFEDAAFLKRWQAWSDRIRALDSEVGMVFYGYWLPPAFYSLPPRGFVNFHPAPLPRLRGYEPETFAILEGWQRISGTFHWVEEYFDTGKILWRTRDIEIQPWHYPGDIIHHLNNVALEALPAFLCSLQQGNTASEQQDAQQATYATVENALKESYVDWEHDDLNKILRRYIAFNYQKNFFTLKAQVEQYIYLVHDLLLFEHNCHAEPGTVLGHCTLPGSFYRQPILQALDGSVVLRLSKHALSLQEAHQINSLKQEKTMFNS